MIFWVENLLCFHVKQKNNNMNLISAFGIIQSLEAIEKYKTAEDRSRVLRELQSDAFDWFKVLVILFVGVLGFAILIQSFF